MEINYEALWGLIKSQDPLGKQAFANLTPEERTQFFDFVNKRPDKGSESNRQDATLFGLPPEAATISGAAGGARSAAKLLGTAFGLEALDLPPWAAMFIGKFKGPRGAAAGEATATESAPSLADRLKAQTGYGKPDFQTQSQLEKFTGVGKPPNLERVSREDFKDIGLPTRPIKGTGQGGVQNDFRGRVTFKKEPVGPNTAADMGVPRKPGVARKAADGAFERSEKAIEEWIKQLEDGSMTEGQLYDMLKAALKARGR